jgi:subtilisin family serine protease
LTWGAIPDAIDLDLARQNYPTINGQGVTIVNLDAGINQDHTAFTGRLWSGHDTDFIANGTGATVHGWNF